MEKTWQVKHWYYLKTLMVTGSGHMTWSVVLNPRLKISKMNYKQYIINMILSMSENHSKLELYTMSILDLVYIKDRLLEKTD